MRGINDDFEAQSHLDRVVWCFVERGQKSEKLKENALARCSGSN